MTSHNRTQNHQKMLHCTARSWLRQRFDSKKKMEISCRIESAKWWKTSPSTR